MLGIMGKIVLMLHWSAKSFLYFFLLLLAACSRPLTTLPTPLALATVPSPSQKVENLPPTWTPPAGATPNTIANFNTFPTLQATETPGPTAILPTSTPFPPTPTRTPTPASPTPYVSFIPRLPPTNELGPSKLGIHVIRNNDAGIMEFVGQARPAVIKAVDDLGFLAEVKTISPWTITIGRIDAGSPNYQANPEAEAQQLVQSQLSYYQANPAVDYWEGLNEPDPNIENMPWYSRFEQERIRLLAQHGYRAAIGSFATGVPEVHEFMLFLDAIAVAKEHLAILSLHEYGAPDMTYLYGGALPGMPIYSDRGALTFRYRWFYRDILEPRNLVIPLVISEAGIDGIIGNRPGPDGYGWADFQDFWVQQGWATDGVTAFIRQLAWYDVGVRQDGYVIGFTIFTAGGIGFWEHYNINPILPDLTNYVLSQQ